MTRVAVSDVRLRRSSTVLRLPLIRKLCGDRGVRRCLSRLKCREVVAQQMVQQNVDMAHARLSTMLSKRTEPPGVSACQLHCTPQGELDPCPVFFVEKLSLTPGCSFKHHHTDPQREDQMRKERGGVQHRVSLTMLSKFSPAGVSQ